MTRTNELERRLTEWGREYGGGKYEDTGWQGVSPIVTLMTYHGRAPEGFHHVPSKNRTPADDVQDSVSALGRQSQGWLPAQVIRIEYCNPGKPIESKLQALKKIGCQTSRVRYYQLLRLARVHVAGWLRMPFSDDVREEAA
jgi:hypothetical protein